VIAALLALLATPPPLPRLLNVDQAGEAVLTFTARCNGCDWSSPKRPGAVLVLEIDNIRRYVVLTSPNPTEVAVSFGHLEAGPHHLLDRGDIRWLGKDTPFKADNFRVRTIPAGSAEHRALAYAPVLHPRPKEVGRFTDVAVVRWYVTVTTERGTRLGYSVIFSNVDGGTPADRLLATWGRLTDIEYVLGIEFDHDGRVLEATYQGPDHKILPYRGIVPGRHPELWVVTDYNMVSDHGTTEPTFAPVPIPFDLSATSREAVMDAQPWTYQVSSQEAFRERRVDKHPKPGSHHIFDPRRYVYVEACAETKDAALTFGVAVDGKGGLRWSESDAGQKDYRIIRQSSEFPNGCFRGAAALPADAAGSPLRAMRFRAYTRRTRDGEPPIAPGTAKAAVVRVNKVFRLGSDFLPGPSLFDWKGSLALEVDGPAREIPVPAAAAP
jgi:hypothetical protein